ncbi:MAG: AbrB/MazE/SpoVT family DNA-binding domain-containing protein [Reyranellaceae bacterium]
MKVKVTTVGNSVGVVLPKEVLARLKIDKGDTLTLVETPNGIELTPYDSEFDAVMEAARKGMRKYRNALRELAK